MNSNETPSRDEEIALANCENEPVHIPGRVQSFGATLGFDRETTSLKYYSENLVKLFPGLTHPDSGMVLSSVWDNRAFSHAIRGALGLPSIETQRDRVGVFNINGVAADVSVFANKDDFVVDLEPIKGAAGDHSSGIPMVRSMVAAVETGRGVERLLESAVLALRHLTGFDRVMAYRFFANADGEVVADAHGPGIESFLGLRYPASDIPAQVRQLMVRSTVRLISDVEDPHSPIQTFDFNTPLDLSLSHLRGFSPIHAEYLGNMGVGASMNTSLVVGGQLWGLFALHHCRSRRPSADVRSVAELFGQLVSIQIQQEIEREASTRSERISSVVEQIEPNTLTLKDVVSKYGAKLASIGDWDGFAIVSNGQTLTSGDTPTLEAIGKLCRISVDESTAMDSLKATGQFKSHDLQKTAGALIQRFGKSCCLLFFRNEIQYELRWAGSPQKDIVFGPNGPRLEPRASFAEYKESVEGRCREWTRSDESVGRRTSGLMVTLALSDSSILREQWSRTKYSQDLLIAELNHRVRNTLALVRSIARQNAISAESVEQYVSSLEKRITALASAHDLVGASGLQFAKLRDLIQGELRPYLSNNANVSIEGDPIAVRADVAPIISLVIHEMASNAAKYGSLSDDGVSLRVSWKEDATGISLEWIETCSTERSEPSRRGFGLTLIERAIPYECNGKSSITFEGKSVRVSLWLPQKCVVPLPVDEQDVLTKAPRKPASVLAPLTFDSALLLEDNVILAIDMEKLLRAMGIAYVDAYARIDEAVSALHQKRYDVAILDINIGEKPSFQIAEEIIQKSIPLVFVTGYDSKFDLPDTLKGVPMLVKPVKGNELRKSLADLSSVSGDPDVDQS